MKSVLINQCGQKSVTGILTIKEYFFKSVGIPVVRIRYNGDVIACAVAHQKFGFLTVGRRRHSFKFIDIVPVHGQYPVIALKVRSRNLTGNVFGQVIASGRGAFNSSAIGAFAHMKTFSASRVDFKFLSQARPIHQLSKDSLRRGGSANVARADKKNFKHNPLAPFKFFSLFQNLNLHFKQAIFVKFF